MGVPKKREQRKVKKKKNQGGSSQGRKEGSSVANGDKVSFEEAKRNIMKHNNAFSYFYEERAFQLK